ncbi:peptide deformylase, mitochondrial [Hydra vulgaris]|uniref:Peptide deformylase n=1 Tax=Hydra vulgaris TaxID=6087 RepID=A0ABM4CKC6_HYDVU
MSSLFYKLKSEIDILLTREKIKLRQNGDPVLRKVAREVPLDYINTQDFKDLITKMILIMRSNKGQGIAAPQVGVDLQVIAIEFTDHDLEMATKQYGKNEVEKRQMRTFPLHIFINPKLKIINYETTCFEEGCLSILGTVGVVQRYREVQLEFVNEKGDNVLMNFDGWLARMVQHEMHHLKGLLILDFFTKKKNFFR